MMLIRALNCHPEQAAFGVLKLNINALNSEISFPDAKTVWSILMRMRVWMMRLT